jgi:hypothetical protein
MSAHPFDNDPGLPRNLRLGNIPPELQYPLWTHPSVIDHAEEWQTIRDCIAGERTIKLKGQQYLKKLDSEMTNAEYSAFLDRAVFFNMTGRTVSALTGIIFHREPNVEKLPKRLEKRFKFPTRTNITFNAFLKKVCRELISMGRYGVLLDLDEGETATPAPYFTGYAAEHILDWQQEVIDSRLVTTEVVVREIREERGPFGTGKIAMTVIRRLVLEFNSARGKYEYVQYIYEGKDVHLAIETVVPRRIVPTRNGVPFERIPFVFLGAIDNTPEIDRSPVADIAGLNIAHYKSYAQLEHSRYYTAMPVFYAQVPSGAEERTYRVGSSVVWEVAPGEKPGILEMNGHGLNGLVAACEQKEDQISALGGRLMSNQTRSVAESDNSLKLKEGNERSILLNVVFSVAEGMTEMVQKWAYWAGEDNVETIEVGLNKEFLTDTLGARELRAVYAMYVEGIIPLTVMHHYLQKAEVIPDWMDIDQFKDLLANEDEFKNQPDVLARMKGYATAKDRREHLRALRELRNDEELTDVQRQKVTDALKIAEDKIASDEKKAKAAAEAAKATAKVAAQNQPKPGAPAPKPGGNNA